MLLLFSSQLSLGQGVGTAAGVGVATGVSRRIVRGVGQSAGVGAAIGSGASGGAATIQAEYPFISTGASRWNFRLQKFEAEIFGLSMDFGSRLAQNDSVQGLQVKIWDSTGVDRTATMLGNFGISGAKALALVQGGTAPTAYVVDFTATTQQGHRLEDNVTVYVMSDKLN